VNTTLPSVILSVPLEFDAAPTKFSPVSAYLVLANMTEAWIQAHPAEYNQNASNLILAELYAGFTRPYLETKLLNIYRTYKPAAIVIFGEDTESGSYELGIIDRGRQGISTSEIKIPIVNANWTSWRVLKQDLMNLSVLPIVLTDAPENPWVQIRRSWVFITISTVHGSWQLINMILCITILSRLRWKRNLELVVVSFELVANFRSLSKLVFSLAAFR
jgi:hypothetical protein